MSFEVTCGQCSGRLRVDQGGMIVACPHCGAHLDIADPNAATTPAPPEAPAPQPAVPEPAATEPPVTDPAPLPDFTAAPEPAPQPAPVETPFPSFEPAPAETGGIPGFDPAAPLPEAAAPAQQEAVPAEEPAAPKPTPAVTAENTTTFDPMAVTSIQTPSEQPGPVAEGVESTIFQGDSPTAVSSTPLEAVPTPQAVSAPVDLTASPGAATAQAEVESVPAYPSPGKAPAGTVTRKSFMIVASYASAMTLACVWLLMKVLNPTASNLESLPDLEPARDKDGEIGYRLVPEDAPMPVGHSLKLGQDQRFGNLIVTPLRITRGPLEFEHYDPTSTATREPIAGVLKLWLKFKNVSEDQSIAPLRSILFKRDSDDIDNERSNTFVCRGSEKTEDGNCLLVYDHNLSGDWNIVGLNIDEEIPPGESTELFIPTTGSGVDSLFGGDEPLVWRVHFRKGYSPNRFGVTTVVEVNFKEDDVAFDTKPARTQTARRMAKKKRKVRGFLAY